MNRDQLERELARILPNAYVGVSTLQSKRKQVDLYDDPIKSPHRKHLAGVGNCETVEEGYDKIYLLALDVAEKRKNPAAVAVKLIERYGSIGGARHKQWVLDQVVHTLLGDGYDAWVTTMPEWNRGSAS